MKNVIHSSDCAIYNAPALPAGPCNCGAEPRQPTVRLVSSQDTPPTMRIECPNCGEQLPSLPDGTTEQQARTALMAVIIWYQESPIREIQMANDACGRRFPIKEIESALTAGEV